MGQILAMFNQNLNFKELDGNFGEKFIVMKMKIVDWS